VGSYFYIKEVIKMGYNTTGQPHRNGIKNEVKSREWIENNNNKHNVAFLNNIKEVKKKGGTKSKDDLEIIYNNGKTLGISAKNRSKGGATHDWVNSSALNILQCKTLNQVRNLQQSIRNLPLNQRESHKSHFTSFRKQKAAEFIDNLSHTQINDLLDEVFSKISNQKIMVNDKKVGNIQFYDGHNHPIYGYINNPKWKFVAVRGKGIDSAKLYAVSKSDSQKVDLNLRLRQVTNNGDSAAIGLNQGTNKNQNSSLVIKIQQENLENLYAQLQAKNKLISF
jgi:hypothetical protein